MRRTLFSVLLALCTMPSAFGMVMVSGQFKNHSFNSFLIGELNCSGGTGVKLDNLGNFKYNAYTDVGKEIHLVYGISLDKCTTVKIPSDGNLGVIDAESGTRTPGMKEMVAAARERENQPISGRFIGQKFKSAQISLYSCHESGESFAVNSDGTFSRKITNPSNSTKGYIIYPKVGGGTECVPVTIGSDGDVGEIVVETGGTKQENSSQPANETKQIKICLKYENGNPYKRNDMIYTVEINPVGSSKRYLHSDNADRNGCFTADIPNTEQKVNVKVSRGMTFDNVDVGLRNPVAIPRDGNLGTYTVQSSKEREAANEAKEKSSAEKECAGKSGWEVKKENGKWACIEKKQKQPTAQERRDAQKKCDEAGLEQEAKFENGEWKCAPTLATEQIVAARAVCENRTGWEVKKENGKWDCIETKKDNTQSNTSGGTTKTVTGRLKNFYFDSVQISNTDCGKGGNVKVDANGNFSQTVGNYKSDGKIYIQYKKLDGTNDCKTVDLNDSGALGDIDVKDGCPNGQKPGKKAGKPACVVDKAQQQAEENKEKEAAAADERAKQEKQAECDKSKMGEVAEKQSDGSWKCVDGPETPDIKKARIECGGKPDPENWTVVKDKKGNWICQQDKEFTKGQKDQQEICDKAGLAQVAEKHEDGTWFCADTAETTKIQAEREKCEQKGKPGEWEFVKDRKNNWTCEQTKEAQKADKEAQKKQQEICDKNGMFEKAELVDGEWKCMPTDETREKEEAQKDCATREIGEPGVEYEVVKTKGKWVCQKTKKQEKADKQADKQAKEDKQAECDKRKMGEVAEKNENGEWVCVSGKDSDEIKAARIECGGKPDPENWTVVKNGLGKWVCKQDKDFTKEQRKQQKECDKAGLAQTAEKHEDGTWFCADTAETEKIQTVQDECKSKPTPDDWVVEQDKSGNWACVQTKNSTKKEEKRAECSEKRMGVEKKGLLWACADDANITSMWDDLDALEKALSDKLIELKTAAANAEQQSPEQGDGEQGTPGEGDGK